MPCVVTTKQNRDTGSESESFGIDKMQHLRSVEVGSIMSGRHTRCMPRTCSQFLPHGDDVTKFVSKLLLGRLSDKTWGQRNMQ